MNRDQSIKQMRETLVQLGNEVGSPDLHAVRNLVLSGFAGALFAALVFWLAYSLLG